MVNKRGRRVVPKTDGAKLPEKPPAELIGSGEQAAYVKLREDLGRSGFAQKCDLQTVLLACRRMARCQRISAEIDKLPSLMMMDKLHPLLSELRNTETGLLAALGALSLTPRSRSSSRAKATEVAPGLDLEGMDPKKRRILELMP